MVASHKSTDLFYITSLKALSFLGSLCVYGGLLVMSAWRWPYFSTSLIAFMTLSLF